jgi:hypothetical protein
VSSRQLLPPPPPLRTVVASSWPVTKLTVLVESASGSRPKGVEKTLPLALVGLLVPPPAAAAAATPAAAAAAAAAAGAGATAAAAAAATAAGERRPQQRRRVAVGDAASDAMLQRVRFVHSLCLEPSLVARWLQPGMAVLVPRSRAGLTVGVRVTLFFFSLSPMVS